MNLSRYDLLCSAISLIKTRIFWEELKLTLNPNISIKMRFPTSSKYKSAMVALDRNSLVTALKLATSVI